MPIRRLPLTLLVLSMTAGVASAQITLSGQPKPSAATLPDTPPTVTIPEAPKAPLLPGQQPAHRAAISWQTGQLTIKAENSSLNQILREISRQTGMKITGGVADERVYGDYGPGDPGKVLDALLDGTGSNVLLVQNDAAAPAELILTPRKGGATPPNPNAGQDIDNDDQGEIQRRRADDPPAMRLRVPPPRYPRPQLQPAVVAEPDPGIPANAPTNPAIDTSAATEAPATTTEQSPNGVKTPQQIYEQILQLQKARTTPSPPK